METISDSTLYARILQKDKLALEQLYDRYEKLVFSFAYRMTQDQQLAEDVVQNIFIRLWKEHAPYNETKGKFSSWLLTMTRNASLDLLRQRTRRAEVGLMEQDQQETTSSFEDSPEQMLGWKERSETVRLAVRQLKEDQQRIVELFYFHGLSQEAISNTLNIPLGTVKSRIRLALKHLRKHLETERGATLHESTDV